MKKCPKCGKRNVLRILVWLGISHWKCMDCKHEFTEKEI
ncbi:transposase-like protein [Brassicibacter mesophilus]